MSGAHVELQRGSPPNPNEKVFNVRGNPQEMQHAMQLISEKAGLVSLHAACYCLCDLEQKCFLRPMIDLCSNRLDSLRNDIVIYLGKTKFALTAGWVHQGILLMLKIR